jgi:pescadillo protein
MQYPPMDIHGVSKNTEDQQIYLDTKQIQGLQAAAQKKFNKQYTDSIEQIGISDEFKNTPEMVELNKKHEQLKRQRKLFSKCTFLFNREVPIYSLQYLVLSFGGAFLTQDDLDSNSKAKYTHHVLDRLSFAKTTNVEYIQPQYLIDSLNNLFLLPTSQYGPGTPLPAHLSPFVDNAKEGYIPNRAKEISHLKGEEVVESESEEEEEVKPTKKASKKAAEKQETNDKVKGDADSSEEDEESEQDVAATQAEKKKANAKLKKDLEKEQKELAKVLMTNRQRKLYQKAEEEQTSKKEQVSKLKIKRKTIEKSKNKK